MLVNLIGIMVKLFKLGTLTDLSFNTHRRYPNPDLRKQKEVMKQNQSGHLIAHIYLEGKQKQE